MYFPLFDLFTGRSEGLLGLGAGIDVVVAGPVKSLMPGSLASRGAGGEAPLAVSFALLPSFCSISLRTATSMLSLPVPSFWLGKSMMEVCCVRA